MFTITYVGAQWCVTCKTIKPAVEKLAHQFAIPLTVQDYDEDLSSEEQDSVRKLPTLFVFQDGKKVADFNEKQVERLDAWLKSNVNLMDATEF